MQSEQLVYADIELPAQRYQNLAQRSAFFERLVETVSSTSGVEGAAAITWAPLTGPGSATGFWVNDRPVPEPDDLPVADIRWVHRDYHRVFGIPLAAGRLFDERDVEGGATVAIVNEVLAARYWPGENPVGKHLSMEWGDTLVAEVIGVVGDVRHGGPATETRETIYWHHRQFQPFRMMTLGIRTAEQTEVVANLIRRVVRDLDPRLPVYNIRVAEDLLEESIAEQRFALVMLGAFASTALLLAVVGIYGVTAYTVGQRTRELGIRIALGATGDRIVSHVVGAGAVRILASLAIAALVMVTGNTVMASMVFGVPSLDLVSMATAFGVLAASGILAAYLPARRAGAVDPMHVLRE